jgi:hypothetical protein
MSRIPHCLDARLTNGGEIISLTRRPRFTPQKDPLVLIYIRGRVNPRATVRLEGLGKFEKSNDLIWNRNHDLPVCSLHQLRYRATTMKSATIYITKTFFEF